MSFAPEANDLICRKIYSLSIIRKDITTMCAVQLCKSMVLPFIDYLNYCLCRCTEKLQTKVQRMQNRALRICLKPERPVRTSDLHIFAKLASIDKRRKLHILKAMHHKVYSVSDHILLTGQESAEIIHNLASDRVNHSTSVRPTRARTVSL